MTKRILSLIGQWAHCHRRNKKAGIHFTIALHSNTRQVQSGIHANFNKWDIEIWNNFVLVKNTNKWHKTKVSKQQWVLLKGNVVGCQWTRPFNCSERRTRGMMLGFWKGPSPAWQCVTRFQPFYWCGLMIITIYHWPIGLGSEPVCYMEAMSRMPVAVWWPHDCCSFAQIIAQ